MKRTLLTLLIAMASLAPTARLAAQPLLMRHLSSAEGLSSNTVMSLLQDRNGFIWIGTKNGLNRYDGHEIEVFMRDEQGRGLPNGIVLSMDEDSDGRIWISTDKGIACYDPQTGHIEAPLSSEALKREVCCVRVDKAGRVWLAVQSEGGGLYSYDRNRNRLARLYVRGLTMRPRTVYVSADSMVYVGLINRGLLRYDPVSRRAKVLVDNLTPTTLCDFGQGRLLMGTDYDGLYLVDTRTGKSERIDKADSSKEAVYYARSILGVADGEYWIGTERGIFVWHVGEGMTRMTHEDFNSHTISDNAVYALCRDNDGGVWVGSYFGGVDYLPRQSARIRSYYPLPTGNSIAGFRVRDIVEDARSRLWVATEDAGLCLLDRRTGRWSQFTEQTQPRVSFSNIQCLCLVGQELWVGTFTKGIDVIDLLTGRDAPLRLSYAR